MEDSSDRSVLTPLSADIVEYLCSHGRTLEQVGVLLGVSKSYISRVKNRERSLTIDHLLRLEKQLGTPLPLLLLEATPRESIPSALRPAYEDAVRMFAARRRRKATPARR